MALLEIRNLTVTFGDAAAPAVQDVSLHVERGEVLGVVGESGSGKSVTMLAAMGLVPPPGRVQAGRVEFAGHDLAHMPAEQRRRLMGKEIAMIFQDPLSSLNPSFTVGFQLDETLRYHGPLGRKARRRRAIELLEQVGIPSPETRLRAYPHQLSGGMSQRVMIAIAIACNPLLLIADEPTTALDVTIQAQILDLLLTLQRDRGMGLILISHNMGVVAETANRVIVMYAGEVVEQQDAATLFTSPSHPYTAALLRSSPDAADADGVLMTIPGMLPGAHDRPPGCLFQPRCGRAALPDCGRHPALRPWPGGNVRCHFPLGASEPAA